MVAIFNYIFTIERSLQQLFSALADKCLGPKTMRRHDVRSRFLANARGSFRLLHGRNRLGNPAAPKVFHHADNVARIWPLVGEVVPPLAQCIEDLLRRPIFQRIAPIGQNARFDCSRWECLPIARQDDLDVKSNPLTVRGELFRRKRLLGLWRGIVNCDVHDCPR